MMHASTKVAIAVALATLGGCDNGGSGTNNNAPESLSSPGNILSNSVIPASLAQANDRKTSSRVASEDPAASSDTARISLIEMGYALNDLQPAQSASYSQNMLIAGSGYLEDRLFAVSDDWKMIEGVLDQIIAQCQTVAYAQNCVVPIESLHWQGDQRGEWVSAVNYKRNGDLYAHELSLTMNHAGKENSLSFSWDDERTRYLTISAGSWDVPAGTYSSSVQVTGSGAAQEIQIKDTMKDDVMTYEESQHLTQLADGIKITGSSTITTDRVENRSTSTYIANSDGGTSTLTTAFEMNGTSFNSHIKEDYSSDGTTVRVLFCDEADGTDCSDESAWQDITFPYIDESQLCPDDLPEGAVCDLPLIEAPFIDETQLCPDDLPEDAVCESPVDPIITEPDTIDETELCPDDLPAGAVCDSPEEPMIVEPGIIDETELCPDDLPTGAVCDSPQEPMIVEPGIIDETTLCPDDLPADAVCDSPQEPMIVEPGIIDETELCPDDLPAGAVCDSPQEPMIAEPGIIDETELCPDDLPAGAVCDSPQEPMIVEPGIIDETELCPDDLPAGAVCDSPEEPMIVEPGIIDETELCPDDLPAGAVCDSPEEPMIVEPGIIDETELCPDDLPAGAVCDSPLELINVELDAVIAND